MDTSNISEQVERSVEGRIGEGSEERLADTVFEAVGEGTSGTPVMKKRRRNSVAGLSPDEEERVRRRSVEQEEGVQRRLRTEVEETVKELRDYVRADFHKTNKDSRNKYFERRFALIEENVVMMDAEYRRAWGMAERVGSMERNFDRLVKKDWGSEVSKEIDIEVSRAVQTITESAKRIMEETLGRMSRKVEEIMMASQHAEEERERSLKEMEVKTVKRLESMMGVVGGLEQRLLSVEKFMEETQQNMDRTYAELQKVGVTVREDLKGVVDVEKRTEGKVTELAERLDVERISKGVEDAKKMMEEVAGVVGGALRGVERMEVDEDQEGSYAQVVRRRRRKGPTVILEGPGEKAVTREQVVECLDPKKGDVRVRGLRRQGKDFVVELHAEEDVERLRRNTALEGIGVKVDGAAKLRWPRVVVHDVEKEIERDDLVDAVLRRNGEILGGLSSETVKQGFIPEFMRGRRDQPVRSWVVRVSPEIFRRLMRMERLYVGVRSCRVMEFNSISRCYRCQGLGHIRKFCKNQERCGHCAGQHDLAKCEKKQEEPSCVNCERLNLRDRRHEATSRDCPALMVVRRRVENITDYGS